MSDEICGEPTTDGGKCQNAAGDDGTCWIPSHGDDDAENPHGRPTKLEERKEDILSGAGQGMSKEGCARLAGVAESTLYRWLDEYEDFSEAFRRARAHGELKHLQSVNDSGSRFLLERSFGYTKTEKREVDLDADVDQTTTHELGQEEKEIALETIRELQERESA